MADTLATAEQAIARANALTRLSAVSKPPAAELTKVADDVTPFLGERNVGKPAWRVEYPGVAFRFASAVTGFADPYRRTAVVMLEAASGRLFYVTCIADDVVDPDMRPMPSCGVATEQLSREEEVYDGYPDQLPIVDFLTALERILSSGVGSPFQAKEIHGAYVLHSHMGSKPKPAWAITLRGLPPVEARGPHGNRIPVWQRNHMRNVVDAASGRVLFATNSPQPI